MGTNVFEFPIDRENSQLGWVVFSKCQRIRRRMNYLTQAEERNKVVRKRTVRRCLEVINEKGSELSGLLHGCREVSPKMLISLLKLFIEELLKRQLLDEAGRKEVLDRLLTCALSPTEAEMIVYMLENLGMKRRHILGILRGDTVSRIIQVSDEAAYQFIRKVLSLPKYS